MGATQSRLHKDSNRVIDLASIGVGSYYSVVSRLGWGDRSDWAAGAGNGIVGRPAVIYFVARFEGDAPFCERADETILVINDL